MVCGVAVLKDLVLKMEFDNLQLHATNMLAALQPVGVGLIYNDIKGNVEKLSRHAGKNITTDVEDWVSQYKGGGVGGENPFTWLCWLKWASELICMTADMVCKGAEVGTALNTAYSKTLIHRHNSVARTMAKATFAMMSFDKDIEWEVLHGSSLQVCSIISVYIE